MADTIQSTLSDGNGKNLQIFQHNCRKSPNVMYSCLEYATQKKIDLMLLQESWTEDNKTISHSNFTCIWSNIQGKNSFRVCAYVSKINRNLKCTLRPDLINDSDCQILNISIGIIQNLKIINVYNKRNEQRIYINNRILLHLEFPTNSDLIICGNFNTHHS